MIVENVRWTWVKFRNGRQFYIFGGRPWWWYGVVWDWSWCVVGRWWVPRPRRFRWPCRVGWEWVLRNPAVQPSDRYFLIFYAIPCSRCIWFSWSWQRVRMRHRHSRRRGLSFVDFLFIAFASFGDCWTTASFCSTTVLLACCGWTRACWGCSGNLGLGIWICRRPASASCAGLTCIRFRLGFGCDYRSFSSLLNNYYYNTQLSIKSFGKYAKIP